MASSTVVTRPSRISTESPLTYVAPSVSGFQSGSRALTTGILTKLNGGGGDVVPHSSVGAPHGLAGAGFPFHRLQKMFTTRSSMLKSLTRAPIVETKFSVPQPVSAA